MIQLYFGLFFIGVIGAAGYGAYAYYQDTQERLQVLAENNAKLEVAIKQNEETMKEMEKSAEAQAQLSKELDEKLQKTEVYKDELISKLQKHDLTMLSIKKPGLIEKRINDGTKKVFDDIESDTAK